MKSNEGDSDDSLHLPEVFLYFKEKITFVVQFIFDDEKDKFLDDDEVSESSNPENFLVGSFSSLMILTVTIEPVVFECFHQNVITIFVVQHAQPGKLRFNLNENNESASSSSSDSEGEPVLFPLYLSINRFLRVDVQATVAKTLSSSMNTTNAKMDSMPSVHNPSNGMCCSRCCALSEKNKRGVSFQDLSLGCRHLPRILTMSLLLHI